MGSQSHLAGTALTVDGRFHRQLCQWCGLRLHDMDLRNVAIEGSDTDWKPPAWEVSAWIRIEGQNPTAFSVVEVEEGKMPADSCMRDVSPLLKSVPGPSRP